MLQTYLTSEVISPNSNLVHFVPLTFFVQLVFLWYNSCVQGFQDSSRLLDWNLNDLNNFTLHRAGPFSCLISHQCHHLLWKSRYNVSALYLSFNNLCFSFFFVVAGESFVPPIFSWHAAPFVRFAKTLSCRFNFCPKLCFEIDWVMFVIM